MIFIQMIVGATFMVARGFVLAVSTLGRGYKVLADWE
jgi:hypothetical protein